MTKKSYFQGTTNPTKKYKKDPQNQQMSRFKEPFYSNYDLYPSSIGPGSGWNSMNQYKSIADFIKDRRKKSKDKYLSEKKIKAFFRLSLIKNAQELSTDNISHQLNSFNDLIDENEIFHPFLDNYLQSFDGLGENSQF